MKKAFRKFKQRLKYLTKPFDRVNRVGMKMMIFTLMIIVASDILTFTSTIVIGYVTGGGATDVSTVIGSVVASILIGGIMAFFVTNTILKPLSSLTKATRRVANGDYSVKVDENDFITRHTLKELRQLISDFNRMTEELANTELFRSDFISNFSHEFKTPLSSISGFARQLCDGDIPEERRKEFSKIILEEAEYLSALAANTQLLTSLDNKEIIADKTVFSLDEQLRNCMLSLEPVWSKKNIELNMSDVDEVKFYFNEQLMSHVWHNLFDNAVKFTPDGGFISVSCRQSGNRIIVEITDSGCGISEEAIPHIFEKFYQADRSHASKGNGLGLSLVKKIVELSGGKVSVSSVLGKGTTFTVNLPSYESKKERLAKGKDYEQSL